MVGGPAYAHVDLAPSMMVASKVTPDGEAVQSDDGPAHCCQCSRWVTCCGGGFQIDSNPAGRWLAALAKYTLHLWDHWNSVYACVSLLIPNGRPGHHVRWIR